MRNLFSSLSALLLLSMLLACPKPTTPPQEIQEPVVPVVHSISPSQIEVGGQADVRISGENFEMGARVEVGPDACRDASVVSSELINCTVSGALPVGSHTVRVINPDGEDAVRTGLFRVQAPPEPEVPDCSLQTIPFDYDSSSLAGGSRTIIEANAACIEQKGYQQVRLAGHCDDRGSTEYNLNLGQLRADSVRNYLQGLGLSVNISTVSYGEEQPVSRGRSEDAWRQNRRVELTAE